MTAALEFRHVDVLFPRSTGRNATKAVQAALARLDAGDSRDEIAAALDVIVGVADANLSVAPGEICVVMGLSGSGKSTLLRTANGLTPATRGAVLLSRGAESIDIAHCDADSLCAARRSRVSMVFQQFGLLPWRTVEENVGFGLELRGEPRTTRERIVAEKLELVGLTQWAKRHVAELSGGMQQRVGLARAFATEADILLMDEPFSALDPLIRGKLQNELCLLQERVRKTILFVSHDIDEALRLGDRIAIMQHGRIVQTGTPQDIVLRPADPYVAEFVQHMNPLTALTGSMLMQSIGELAHDGDAVVFGDGHYRLRMDSAHQARELSYRGAMLTLHAITDSGEPPAGARGALVAPAATELRTLIRLRRNSGHPLLLADEQRIVGICDEREILQALGKI